MPAALIVLSLVGLVFFGVKLVTDPGGWLAYGLGAAACVLVCVRNVKVVRSDRKMASIPSLHEVTDAAVLDAMLASDRAILYKHSTSCPVSAVVIGEVFRFAEQHPDWPVYILKVIERRDLSDAVAERLDVAHESPQAVVIKHGRSVWHTSHFGIRAQQLSQQVV